MFNATRIHSEYNKPTIPRDLQLGPGIQPRDILLQFRLGCREALVGVAPLASLYTSSKLPRCMPLGVMRGWFPLLSNLTSGSKESRTCRSWRILFLALGMLRSRSLWWLMLRGGCRSDREGRPLGHMPEKEPYLGGRYRFCWEGVRRCARERQGQEGDWNDNADGAPEERRE